MKIGIISDIHIDINKEYKVIDELINQIINNKLDYVLIAGDISEEYKKTIDIIEKLNYETTSKVYFVPGNHDMWQKEEKMMSTNTLYEKYKDSKYCVSEKTIYLNDEWILIGNIGWYDYSYGKNHTKKEYDKMSKNERTWQDKKYNDWCENNVVTNNWQIETIEKEIKRNINKKIILMTHMISHENFKVPDNWSETIDWNYFNAFLGSNKYKNICDKYGIKYAIMGHVHFRGEIEDNKTKYICSCLNYYNEWQSDNLKKEINEALKIIEL